MDSVSEGEILQPASIEISDLITQQIMATYESPSQSCNLILPMVVSASKFGITSPRLRGILIQYGRFRFFLLSSVQARAEEIGRLCSGFIYLRSIIYANLHNSFKVPGISSLPVSFASTKLRQRCNLRWKVSAPRALPNLVFHLFLPLVFFIISLEKYCLEKLTGAQQL